MSRERSLKPTVGVSMSPGETFMSNTTPVSASTPRGSRRKNRKLSTTPTVSPSKKDRHPKKPRRSLKFSLNTSAERLLDSGSEGESGQEGEEEEAYDILAERANSRRLRNEVVQYETGCEKDDVVSARECQETLKDVVMNEETVIGAGEDEQPTLGPEYNDLDIFSWSDNFSSFSGQAETYLRSPGPTVKTRDPVDLFMEVFDEKIVNLIVTETNRYAWQIIGPLSEMENGLPEYFEWTDTSVPEMYRYIATLILMSMCYRSRIRDYWTTDILQMPKIRKIISRNRFLSITRVLHFVDNDCFDFSQSSYDKKISKIRPILDHCNLKFASLYVPNKHLSLDESLLLWKGRLNWVQCIRTKAARFGIKSFELCEAATGYQLRCLLYAGKKSTTSEAPNLGFENCAAKVVLELMDGFLDVGHTLVMDNWYNQLPLTRFLKRRRTDVIGTINPRQVLIPDDIKLINEKCMNRGEQIARHCGDISLVAWKDVKLFTIVSTCHTNRQMPSRAGISCQKPEAILEYNKYMGGVDSKDQKLSMFLMERKRGRKWYMKVFKRLLNTSLLNTYIIYTKNPMIKPLSHRDFRNKVAVDLLERFPLPTQSSVPLAPSGPVTDKNIRRLMKADHFVQHTETIPGKRIHKQSRCVRCTAAGRRTMVTLICAFCNVPLCAGRCWAEYHTLSNLK